MDPQATKIGELRKLAKEYYESDGGGGSMVLERMQTLVNNVFFDNPQDVYGYITNYFQQFCKSAKISKLSAWEIMDNVGQTALQTDLYCVVRNNNKLVCSSSISVPSLASESTKNDDKDLLEAERQKSVERAIALINSEMSEALSGLEPTDQSGIDTILLDIFAKLRQETDQLNPDDLQTPVTDGSLSAKSPDLSGKKKSPRSPKSKSKVATVLLPPNDPVEILPPGCSAVAAVSQSVCYGAASACELAPYEYIASLRCAQAPERFRLPLPMVTILSSGRFSPGKLNSIKEFMVVPSPNISLNMAVKNIARIYNHCAKSLNGKGGLGRLCNDWGALCPQFDRPEQGLDLLEDAIKQLGFEPGQEFSLAINCAGHEMLDYEKGKYEVTTGQLKSPDELVKYWTDLLARYPSIIALVDPMRRQEKEQWMSLCEAVSSRCYVIGDSVYRRPGLLKEETFSDDFQASAVTLRLQQMTTVTDILTCAKKVNESGTEVAIGSSVDDTTDSRIVDLAVGVGAKFIRVGGPCRGERVAKLNRLLEIEAELRSQDRLLTGEDHSFRSIKIPDLTEDRKDESQESNHLSSPSDKDLQKTSPKEHRKQNRRPSQEERNGKVASSDGEPLTSPGEKKSSQFKEKKDSSKDQKK